MTSTFLRQNGPRAVGVGLLAALLCSCATIPDTGAAARARATTDPAIVAARQKLVDGARAVVGKKELVVRGKRFNWDCTGAVLAIYWYAGIDLARDFDRYAGNGVVRLYKSLDARALLYTTTRPLPGDLIFWDNTYDQNENGKWDDQLTHVGMVMATAQDGEVSYVHHNVSKGIVIEYMNLTRPAEYQSTQWGSTRVINSPMRQAEPGKPHPANWLSGQLYRIFGMGYLF